MKSSLAEWKQNMHNILINDLWYQIWLCNWFGSLGLLVYLFRNCSIHLSSAFSCHWNSTSQIVSKFYQGFVSYHFSFSVFCHVTSHNYHLDSNYFHERMCQIDFSNFNAVMSNKWMWLMRLIHKEALLPMSTLHSVQNREMYHLSNTFRETKSFIKNWIRWYHAIFAENILRGVNLCYFHTVVYALLVCHLCLMTFFQRWVIDQEER